MVPFRRVPVSVDAPVPTGTTNSYVAADALVDPAARTERLDTAVSDADVAHLVCTHTHPDHVGAVAHYAETTDATVWAHARHAERFERATGVAPDRTFREGDSVGVLDVVATPGHAPDHVAFELDDAYLVGDLARADGSVAIGRDGDMRAYLTSLRRLHARDPDRLYPGHGAPIDRPRDRLAQLLAHRREREARVHSAVDAGAETLEGVVDAAYDTDLTGVREHANATVAAHLAKLAVEGRVPRTWRDAR